MTFQELNIIPSILKSLKTENYAKPTPIQAQSIPPIIAGRDLLGIAQTGTGKTAAFAVPILQNLEKGIPARSMNNPRGKVRSLILTPTRELALQIYESLCAYGSNSRLRISVIFGGVSQKPQEIALARGVDILVATPGRLKDLMNQGLVNLQNVEILTLDEADRMLDMGFAHDVKHIIARTPLERQTLFFSATMPKEIVQLSRSILKDPVKVSVTPDSPTVDKISQSLYMVNKKNKFSLLEFLLRDLTISSLLVFTRTKHGADRVVRELTRCNISAQAIHGNKSQNARQIALNNFKSHKIRVLVATDIAARGIDIDELSHVINFDLPEIPESYVHRIGRTGRAGHEGVAISFCDIEEKKALRDIEKLCGRSIPLIENHPFSPLNTIDTTENPSTTKIIADRNHTGRKNIRPIERNNRQPVEAQSRRPINRSGRRPVEQKSRRPVERRA
jgi:ATP-dependent RNA helicase RhlE